jgi:hypothetical protein
MTCVIIPAMSRKRSALVLAVTALAACGGQPRTPPGASPSAPARAAGDARPAADASPARIIPMAPPSSSVSLDACGLLTTKEVEAALGKRVGAGVPQSLPNVASCRWTAASGLESASVAVVAHEGPGRARASFKTAMKTNGYRSIPGPGEGAYASPMNDITVLTGRYELAVDVNLMDDDQAPVARKLAGLAVARLPR